MRNSNQLTLIFAAVMAAVLAGCGGGGGGDTTPGPLPPPVDLTAPDLQTSVPAPTYAADSDELRAWKVLQQAREACGFGLLQQDARLDAAAKAHVHYLTLNPTFGLEGHQEVAGNPGFTGASPSARAAAQGFKGMASEVIAFHGTGQASMRNLLAVPYHGMSSLWVWRSAGLAFGKNLLVVNYGSETAPLQRLGAGVVAHYPCEGAENVDASWTGEVPEPFPDLVGPRGTSVMLAADLGSTLTIANFSMVREATGQSEPLRTLTKDNDRNKILKANEFAAVPIAALAHGETYRVSYSGTLDGVAIHKAFTFKTMPKPRSILTCRNPHTGETYPCYADNLERV